MVRTYSSTAALLLLVGLLWSPARGADAPDLSTPKKAAVSFAKGVEAADMSAVKASSVGTEDDYKLVQSIVDFISSAKQLREAAVAKFGEEGKTISNDDMANLSKQVESGEEKITGDTATVGKPQEPDPMKLKKVDGNWKVDLASIPEKEQMGKAMPKMQKVMSNAATDIKAGKYKTADEAKQAIGQQIFAVVAEQLNGAGAGAGTPPAPPAPKPEGGEQK